MTFILQGKKKRKIDAVSSYLRETFRYAHVYKENMSIWPKNRRSPFS